MDEMDDMDQGAYDRYMAELDRRRVLQVHEKTGYREGIQEGSESEPHLQLGFDIGFRAAAGIGMAFGRDSGLRAIQRSLGTHNSSSGPGSGDIGTPDQENTYTSIFTDSVLNSLLEADANNPPEEILFSHLDVKAKKVVSEARLSENRDVPEASFKLPDTLEK
ncbi:MAG: hypothetical protein SGCHY_004510 [Lobulomycetales sp.]